MHTININRPHFFPARGKFLIKGVVLSTVLAVGVMALADRFTIAIAGQKELCLPPYRIWLIDKSDKTPVRGATFSFKSEGLAPVFADGTLIVKILDGLPGDKIEVTTEATKINGQTLVTRLPVAQQLGLDTSRYIRQGAIKEGSYWFLGRTDDSFDSRYWGSVAAHQIFGRAYPLW